LVGGALRNSAANDRIGLGIGLRFSYIRQGKNFGEGQHHPKHKHHHTRSNDDGGPCCSVGGGVQQSSAPQQAEREGEAPPEVEELHPALQDPSRRECGAVQLGVGNSTFTSLKTNNTTDAIAAHPVIATAVIRRNLRVFILVKQ
jgi:hypothetical protein